MLGWVEFYCIEDEPFNKDAFLTSLESNFVNGVKDGHIVEN